MSEKILVGVNGSVASERAVRWASEWAAAHGVDIQLVTVIDGAIRATGHAAVLLDAQAHAEQLLADAEQLARGIAGGVHISGRIDQGNAVQVLVDASADARLVVIGTDSRPGDEPSRRGVRGLRISAGSSSPVVVVPEAELDEREGVVVGVDGSEISIAALRFAAREAKRLDTPLIAVYAWNYPLVTGYEYVYPAELITDLEKAGGDVLDEALENAEPHLEGVEVRRVVVGGEAGGILREHGATAKLLVVGSHGRGPVARFLLGSVSQEVLGRVLSPTMVVR